MTPKQILAALAAAFIILALTEAKAATVTDSVLTVGATEQLKTRQFEDRQDFHTVVFEGTPSAIPDYCFSRCSNLREISIPKGVTKIGRGAFAWCPDLRKVKLPAGLKDIASQAFAYCSSLPDIGIPKAVRHIGANAFSFCSSLYSISLPPAMTELESYAFSECSNLHKAVLPANAHLLGEMIFAGCRLLESISVDSRTPPPFDCKSQPFDPEETYLYSQCTLRVPAGTQRLYSEAPGWNLFSNILPL